MNTRLSVAKILIAFCIFGCLSLHAALTPEQLAQLPPPASHPIDFTRDIKPIFESSCVKCHARGRAKGGLRLDTLETVLKGGDTGPAIVPGKSAASLLIELVQGFDPDSAMPKKGTKLTPEQIGLLRAWIDQGATWDKNVSFARQQPLNLVPHRPQLPAGHSDENPIDQLLTPYFTAHDITAVKVVDDRVFARRCYLDIIGLLPTPAQLTRFERDMHHDKRELLVRALLADNVNYAQHWMSFWNDVLRNDYGRMGSVKEGGRIEITRWLYSALATNMPYDQFVSQLVAPTPASEGFTHGILWRGTVNASQTPEMQAAQNISQVFMGVNLKCASCHDSFVNDFMLSDAYGLAGVYSDAELEMVHCDKPTGQKAPWQFIYPQLGTIDPKTDKATRLKRLAEIITQRQDGRLTRTLVNRFWQRFMGHGLVEPVDEMEKPAWNPDVLDWLAEDFADHHYDIRHLIAQIVTSRAYQMPAVSVNEKDNSQYVFRGPDVRRMSAEQFCDAVSELTGIWPSLPAAEVDFSAGAKNLGMIAFNTPFPAKWIWANTNASTEPLTRVYFRKTITIDDIPEEATVVASAPNDRLTLYVNGRQATANRDSSLFHFKDMRRVNIQPLLVKGTNTFSLMASNMVSDEYLPGVFIYAMLRSRTGPPLHRIMDFGTDVSWQVSTQQTNGWEKADYVATDWTAVDVLTDKFTAKWHVRENFHDMMIAMSVVGHVRYGMVNADPLQVALERPNRAQTVTIRSTAATTLQALEFTNGKELAGFIHDAAKNLTAGKSTNTGDLVPALYSQALGRKPSQDELALASELVGQPARPDGVEDLLWSLTMLPEFQLIY